MGMAKKGLEGLSDLLQVYLVEEINPVVAERFQEKYNEIIRNFYNDYKPKAYYRTGATYDMTSVAYGYQDVPGSSKNKIRINVDAKYLGFNPYWSIFGGDADPEKIFYNTYVKGNHGNAHKIIPNYYIKPMSPPPQKEMNDWWHSFVQGDEFRDIVKDAMPQALARVKAKLDR